MMEGKTPLASNQLYNNKLSKVEDILKKQLHNDADLFAAALLQAKVTIIQRTADDIPYIHENNGIVEKITPVSIKVSGAYYFRMNVNFIFFDFSLLHIDC